MRRSGCFWRAHVVLVSDQTALVVTNMGDNVQPEPQATHRLQISEAAFRELALAIYHQSLRDFAFSSPRQVITAVLNAPENRLYQLDDAQLDQICDIDVVEGRLRVNIRLDSNTNDRMRSFRDHAEHRLGRPVSVVEAIHACSFVANLDQLT